MSGQDDPSGSRTDATAKEHSPDQLLPLVYDELRRIAGRFLSGERAGHTLQPTAVVHEAYLRLAGQSRVQWQGRSHFLALSATMMRRLLIDHARARERDKRGADWQRVTLEQVAELVPGAELDLGQVLDLDAAIERLATIDTRQARVVELRVFAGMTHDEIAEQLEVSRRTVAGLWSHGRAWLRRELDRSRSG